MRDIIQFFTKENELVFDSFMGVGGTLLGAALCNRKALGIDLNPEYIKAYKKASKSLGLPIFKTVCGDSKKIIAKEKFFRRLLDGGNISLMLIDPPYFNMMSKKKTGGDIVNYARLCFTANALSHSIILPSRFDGRGTWVISWKIEKTSFGCNSCIFIFPCL